MKNVQLLKSLKNKKIMVIGDIMLDSYSYGDVERISPEAPVPVVLFKKEEFKPGGASNVAFNLTGLGVQTTLIGVCGDDSSGRKIVSELNKNSLLNCDGILIDESNPTIEKLRIIGNQQQMLRIDKENVEPVKGALFNRLKKNILSQIESVDAVIFSDYGKGLITKKLIEFVLDLKRKHKFIVSVDPKIGHFFYYKGVDLITPNNKEASEAAGFKITNTKQLQKASEKIRKSLKCTNLLITLGADGMMLFNNQNEEGYHIPTEAQNVYDVTGAGDTVVSVMTAIMSLDVPVDHAARLANKAAGIVVGSFGTTAITLDALIRSL